MADVIVTPPIFTGCNSAKGVRTPVLPIFTEIVFKMVVEVSEGNL